MEQYKSSSGVKVWIQHHVSNGADVLRVEKGGLEESIVGAPRVQALREFFRAEEDERLGRTRATNDPDIVIYLMGPNEVRLVDMCGQGNAATFARDDVDGLGPMSRAAKEHFDAHAAPKPAWHDAKPGEAWAIHIGDGNWQPVVVHNGGRFLYRGGGSVAVTADYIEDGYRIWPEVAS